MPKKNERSLAREKGRHDSLELVLPATSANLGPGFDAAALAFDLDLKVRAWPAKDFSITASGRDAAICSAPDNHLILCTYREVLESEGKSVTPLALEITNEIPIGKGCGSSAAARLAGISLAVHLGKLKWNDNQIVGEASRREHHPDNAAACWFGGVVVARMSEDAHAQVAQIRPRGKWRLLLAVPEEILPTQKARDVLPAEYSRADTVTNIQNSMLLVAAFAQGRHDLLDSALQDRVHQPYRAALCPLLPALQKLAGSEEVLGAVLSGAGPSVLVFLDPRASERKVRHSVRQHLARHGISAELLLSRIVLKGARDGRDWKRQHAPPKP
jgi:homoserine kinase